MRWRGALWLLLVGSSLAWAAPDESSRRLPKTPLPIQMPIPDAPLGPFGDGIVYQADGTPLAGAEVLAYWADSLSARSHGGSEFARQTTTDRNGMFALNLPEDRDLSYIRAVVRDGKGNQATTLIRPLDGNQPIMRLVMQEETYYRVRVVDEQEKPQPGVKVHVAWPIGPWMSAETDANGEAWVPATQVNEGLLARLPGKGIAHRSIAPPPSPRGNENAKVVEMRLEQARPREVLLTDPDDRPLVGGVVELSGFRGEFNHSYRVSTDDEGRATIDVPMLNGTIVVYKDGHASATVHFAVPDRQTGEIEWQKKIVLPEMVTLRGEVFFEPNLDFDIKWRPHLRVSYSGMNRWVRVHSDTLNVGEPGPFEIKVPAETQLILKAFRQPHDSRAVFLSVPRGQELKPVRLEIMPPVKIQGMVRDAATEEPIADREVEVALFRADPQEMRDYFAEHPLAETDLPLEYWLGARQEKLTVKSDHQGKFELEAYAGYCEFQETERKQVSAVRFDAHDSPKVTVWGVGQAEGNLDVLVQADPAAAEDTLPELWDVICHAQNKTVAQAATETETPMKYRVPRSIAAQTVVGWNKQRTLGIITQTEPGAETVTLKPGPLVKVVGDVVSAVPEMRLSTGNMRVMLMSSAGHGVVVPLEERTVAINRDHSFAIDGLIPGAEYWLTVFHERTWNESDLENKRAFRFTAPEAGTVFLRDVKLRPR